MQSSCMVMNALAHPAAHEPANRFSALRVGISIHVSSRIWAKMRHVIDFTNDAGQGFAHHAVAIDNAGRATYRFVVFRYIALANVSSNTMVGKFFCT